MREELRLVNALIGMALPSMGWPTVLADFGFRVIAIQRDVSLVVDGQPGIVTPEAVFFADGWCLLVESKSSSFSTGQARKYWRLEANDLLESGILPREAEGGETAFAVYFCQEIHRDTLGGEIDTFNEQEPAELPLASYDNHRFELSRRPNNTRRGEVPHEELRRTLERGVYFNERMWPQRFLPFDEESPQLEVARLIVPELTHLLYNPDIDEFSAHHLLGGHPAIMADGALMYWMQLGSQAQRRLVDTVFEIVEELRVHYLSRYFTRAEAPKTFRKKVDDISHPLQVQAVHEKTKDYLLRKETGARLPQARGVGQASLEFGEEPDG